MSLLELQKFLLEYQRVSLTLTQGRGEGVGSGIGTDLVFQGSPCRGAGVTWWGGVLPGAATT